ncbi:MAG TPA: hypothetical protein VFH61_15215 [Thermoleophilia bacterium]|nr:hypothetical protein [Thermoleophilia bacterium]
MMPRYAVSFDLTRPGQIEITATDPGDAKRQFEAMSPAQLEAEAALGSLEVLFDYALARRAEPRGHYERLAAEACPDTDAPWAVLVELMRVEYPTLDGLSRSAFLRAARRADGVWGELDDATRALYRDMARPVQE